MNNVINETHDPQIRSWVETANHPDTDFPIQNLPFAVFRRAHDKQVFRGGIAIGDQVLDLAAVNALDLFEGQTAQALHQASQSSLNGLMALGARFWSALRHDLWVSLREHASQAGLLTRCLVAQDEVEFTVPATIGDFTDFYASIHHAATVGRMYRPDSPLMPNYKWLPVAYHARSSSIRVSGQRFIRPTGQRGTPTSAEPSFGTCAQLDYELELGMFVGPGNEIGHPIALRAAEANIFGLCILNDWSARDLQRWEYQPLGPFLGKNFATTISPWIVTLEALAPFRAASARPPTDPEPLPNLRLGDLIDTAAIDVKLEVSLQSNQMRIAGTPPKSVARSNFRHAYWTLPQMVAHHTSNGCNLRPGDLLGTGTLSGPDAVELGSFLEVTQGGKQPFMLPTGEQRNFIEDGDTVVMRAWCDGRGAKRIGFGECAATVLPAST